MRRIRWTLMGASLAVAVAGFVMVAGCEKERSTDVTAMGDYSSADHDDAFSDHTATALAITPSSWTFTSGYTNAPGRTPSDLDGRQITFQVTGGALPYQSWRVSSTDLGTIDPVTGVYTVNGYNGTGDNQVSIKDRVGAIATATVTLKFKE